MESIHTTLYFLESLKESSMGFKKVFIYLIITLNFCFPTTSIGQSLNLEVDYSNAEKTLDYLKSRETCIRAAKEILILPSTQEMINHDGKFDKNITQENYLFEISNPDSKTDAFRFKKIRKDIDQVSQLINIITDSIKSITLNIENKLTPYVGILSADKIKVNLILGGNSDGYTNSNDLFNVELQYFANDVEGIINLITHELYHIIQQRKGFVKSELQQQFIERNFSTYNIIENLYREGSATYICDPQEIENPKSHISFLQEKYQRNMSKIEDSFYLFESLLSQSESDIANDDLLYNIGFSGSWDSPFYFVGYQICKELEAKHGKYFIKQYLTMPPSLFLVDYIKLYRQFPQIENKFSARTERYLFNFHKELVTN